MKKLHLTFVLVAMFPASGAFAQQKMDDMKIMDMMKKPATEAQAAHRATGVVKKLDAKTGAVTIAHEPVASLNWPAMTMGFMVKDRAMLDKMVIGRRIDFAFTQGGKGYVITAVK